jgi:hypothetical protein
LPEIAPIPTQPNPTTPSPATLPPTAPAYAPAVAQPPLLPLASGTQTAQGANPSSHNYQVPLLMPSVLPDNNSPPLSYSISPLAKLASQQELSPSAPTPMVVAPPLATTLPPIVTAPVPAVDNPLTKADGTASLPAPLPKPGSGPSLPNSSQPNLVSPTIVPATQGVNAGGNGQPLVDQPPQRVVLADPPPSGDKPLAPPANLVDIKDLPKPSPGAGANPHPEPNNTVSTSQPGLPANPGPGLPLPPSSPPGAFGVAALPLATGNRVEVKTYDVEEYECKSPGTTMEQVSQRSYQTARYAAALQKFNFDHAVDPRLKKDPPDLGMGAKIQVPTVEVLERDYPHLMPTAAPRPVPQVVVPGSPQQGTEGQPITPVPVIPNQGSGSLVPVFTSSHGYPDPVALPAAAVTPPPVTPAVVPASASSAAAGPLKNYVVRPGGEEFYRIAQETLGDGKRWSEIYHLNQKYNPANLVPGGTQLQLPPDAHVGQ